MPRQRGSGPTPLPPIPSRPVAGRPTQDWYCCRVGPSFSPRIKCNQLDRLTDHSVERENLTMPVGRHVAFVAYTCSVLRQG
jgi:hypothetical protein